MVTAETGELVGAGDERLEQIQHIGDLMPRVLARYEIDPPHAVLASEVAADFGGLQQEREFALAPVGPRSMNPYTWENTHCR